MCNDRGAMKADMAGVVQQEISVTESLLDSSEEHSSEAAEASTSSDRPRKVLLWGKTGVGKSTVANALVTGGIEPVVFRSSDGASGCTTKHKTATGRNWKVVDTVGIGDADLSNRKQGNPNASRATTSTPVSEKIIKASKDSIMKYLESLQGDDDSRDEGYSHIIYVQEAGRRTAADGLIWMIFTEIFQGAEAGFVVLFTKATEEWLEDNRDDYILDEMKGYPVFGVNLPPKDDMLYTERMNIMERAASLAELEENLNKNFQKREYKTVLPKIVKMNKTELGNKSGSLFEKIIEKLKSIFSAENILWVMGKLPALFDIGVDIVTLATGNYS